MIWQAGTSMTARVENTLINQMLTIFATEALDTGTVERFLYKH
jgi:hypothetical protein